MREEVLGGLHEVSHELEQQGKSKLEINFIFVKRGLLIAVGIYQHTYQMWLEERREARWQKTKRYERRYAQEEIKFKSNFENSTKRTLLDERRYAQEERKFNFENSTEPPLLKRDALSSEDPPTIALIVEDPANKVSRKISVKSVTPGAINLFGVPDDPSGESSRWEDLASELLQENPEWTEEFLESIDSLTGKELIPKIFQSTFCSSEGKFFKSIANKTVLRNDLIEILVSFDQQFSKGFVVDAPNDLTTVCTAIELGRRLQWEVSEKYLRELDCCQQKSKEEIRKVLKQVKGSFENIEKDADVRKKGEVCREGDSENTNTERLKNSFHSEEEKKIIEDNLREQKPHKETLLKADTLDNVDAVRNALTELKRLNLIVLRMLAKRFQQLLDEIYP